MATDNAPQAVHASWPTKGTLYPLRDLRNGGARGRRHRVGRRPDHARRMRTIHLVKPLPITRDRRAGKRRSERGAAVTDQRGRAVGANRDFAGEPVVNVVIDIAALGGLAYAAGLVIAAVVLGAMRRRRRPPCGRRHRILQKGNTTPRVEQRGAELLDPKPRAAGATKRSSAPGRRSPCPRISSLSPSQPGRRAITCVRQAR